MKKRVFEGAGTALITPFTEDGIDVPAFENIAEEQIERGVSALIVAGTTGEAPTLSEDEKETLCRAAKEVSAGRVPVILGCGSNSTAEAVRRVSLASSWGADAALVVTPYYNKASKEGLVRHFEEVTAASSVPVIAYNVPSRTGVDLGAETLERLVVLDGFYGIKEATGSVARVAGLLSVFGDSLPLYSGSDEVNFPIISLGGAGAISVLSNVAPDRTAALCLAAKERRREGARLAARSYPLCAALFSEVNPIPVKTLMARLGKCREIFRLPLCGMAEEKKKALFDAYDRYVSG